MKRVQFNAYFDYMLNEVRETRDDGQKEYARSDDNVFANFDRVSNQLTISSEKALMVYLLKHIDGITSYLDGHESQREDVSGRIKDSIVYLFLLWAMINGDEDLDAIRPVRKVESML